MAVALFGRDAIDEIRQVPSYAGNRVFRVAVGGRVAFLKLASPVDLRREVAALTLAASAGVPVPEVIAADDTWLATWHVGGRRLAADDPVFASSGALLRRLHEVALDGFGALSDAGGEDGSWFGTIRRRCSGIGAVVAAGLVPGSLADRAVAVVARAEPLLADVRQGQLVHGDFHPRHVYADDGRVTGIIDWGDATVGDPLYDLGRVVHAGLGDGDLDAALARVDSLLPSYVPTAAQVAAMPTTLLVYATVFSLWSMIGEHESGAPWPPWWPIQCAGLERLVTRLEGSG